ncbi:zinc finger matrin-type protein 1-like isoform X2 [Python bivittatus]|uniref:Zinc finger matrin-type protein 1-like isoform X2 n=1 Tax=Python bivittatus TaxID=176946 RepID=A0A9F2KWQ1_PYTBI|nr:zinc finger matrin-type protein 1-like isoform X2 [Python bivittatus]
MAAAPAAAAVAAGRERAEGGGEGPSPPLPPPPRGQKADAPAQKVPDVFYTVNIQESHKDWTCDDIFDEMTRKELCTDTFCKVCGAVLQFESQRIAHYEGKRHAQKVRLYLQMHNERKDRLHMNFQENPNMDKNTYCRLCNMIFTSPVVAQSHYLGKIHAKKVKQLSDQTQPIQDVQSEPDSSAIPVLPEASLEKNSQQDVDSEDSSSSCRTALDLDDPDKYCKLCSATFNNPLMAHQHYVGKKHKRNELRKKLMAEIGTQAIPVESKANALGVGNYICPTCSISLTSIEMYQSHMQGNKHQVKETMIATSLMKNSKKTYSSFQDELADYIKVQKARGLEPKINFRKPEKERCEAINGHEEIFASDRDFHSRNVYEPHQHSIFFPEVCAFSYSVENRLSHPPVRKGPVKLENVCMALYSTDCSSEKQVSQLTPYKDDSRKPSLVESSDGHKDLSLENSSSAEKRSQKLPKTSRAKKEWPQEGGGDPCQHLLTLKRKQCNRDAELEKDGKKKKEKSGIDARAGSKSKRNKVKGSKDGSSEKESKRHKKEKTKYEASGATEEEMLWNESVLGF